MASNEEELRSTLDRMRKTLDEAYGTTRRLHMRTVVARRRVREAQRIAKRRDPALERAEGELREKQAQWVESRKALHVARDEYRHALVAWLGSDGPKDFERLSASYPILLLPARLETRFFVDSRPAELRVRIYPDEIAADTHESELTTAEQASGQQFWRAGWDPATELAAWQALLGQLSPTRAAWVVAATTPTNLAQRPTTPPVFPAVPLKDGSWSRAAQARMLPDRWIVLCYRGGQEVHRVLTGPVVAPLALTLSPEVQPGDPDDLVDISGDGLFVDRDVLWTVDFAEAERAGMAVRIPIEDADIIGGFNRVYAIGVRGSLAADAAANAVEELIYGHHYGRGFAFVPQGTPTNNLTGMPSGYPPPDPDGTRSFRTERGVAQATAGTDAARLASSLGISPFVFEHVTGADRTEQQHVTAMNTLIWPVTWGYFFEQLMPDALDARTLIAVRDYFVGAVRGRGPLPLFRVGSTPYGVLTVSALAPWRSVKGEDPVDTALPDILRALLPSWTKAIPQVPRAGRTGDPDRDLIELLELDASAREVWIRSVFGSDFARNLGAFLEADIEGAQQLQSALRSHLEGIFGVGASRTRLIDSLFDQNGRKFRGGLVSDVPVSEEATLDFNYLAWVKPPTPIVDIRQQRLPDGASRPGSLLYRLVRQALLLMYHSAALDLKIKAKLAQADDRFERELIAIVDGSEDRKTTWQHFTQTIPNVTGTTSIGDYLPQAAAQQRAMEAGRGLLGSRTTVRVTPEVLPLKDYLVALETLQNVSTAELERLTGETLDCCSHRLDAWITSLATRRLDRMRVDHPRGVHVGAFGWVENLRANRASRLQVTDLNHGTPMQVGSGGYIHAPTLDHAAASAVLRNAYLTRSGNARAPYALDLSSERVRCARWLLTSVREGQPLTVLVGYRFERALHERQLDRFIEPLRRLFPLPTAAEAIGPTPLESIAPRGVVHGLELRRAWKDQSLDLGILTTTPAPSDLEQAALSEELSRLDDTLDAVADLLTADSVYQLVRGAQSRAGASLDAVASEARPPEGDFAQAPRGGTTLTHRVALVLGGEPPAPLGWNANLSPRAAAEPRLDRWLGERLGDPANIRARVVLPVPTVNAPDAVQNLPLSFNGLGLRPIDLVAMVPSSGAQIQGSLLPHADDRASRGAELERRIADAALGGAVQRGAICLDLTRDPAWPPSVRSFAEALEIARSLKVFIGGARTLRPADLVAPEHASQAAAADLMAGEADIRAGAAVTALDDCIKALDLAITAIPVVAPDDPEPDLGPLRQELKAGSLFGIPDAYPAIPHSVHTETRTLLDARIADVTAAPPQPDLEPLRDALRRAKQVGIPIEPPQVAEVNSPADSVATLRVATIVSQALAERAASELRSAREALLKLAGTVRDGLAARLSAANAATNADAKMKAVFGSDFVWVPRFRPVRTGELDAALAQGPVLGATSADKHRWLAQAAQVRAPLRRWRRLVLYTSVTGTAPGEFDLAQVPHVDQARWVGLPFATEDERPLAGRVSLALFRVTQPTATDPWCGMIIDEWPEVIPARAETSGLTFHFDDPGAEAAQSLLLAVPPASAENWDFGTVVAILDDALTLAKIRAVHAEQLTDVGQLLPAIYLAANARDDTVSTDFSKDKAVAARIIVGES